MPYLDHAASNPCDPRVITVMTEALRAPGNPSSVHQAGREGRVAVDTARAAIARLLGVAPAEITFVSGATEANVTGIVGAYHAATAGRRNGPFHILTSPLEHASVRAALAVLEKDHGAIIDTLDVGGDGLVSVADVRTRITADTVLVAVMWVNNVFGAVQPIAEIGTAVREERDRRGTGALPILFFSDAVQAMRTEDVRPMDTGVDIMTISAHKMYGPKGAGALWMRNGVGFVPTIVGGGQESARRSGTENLPAIVGFGVAASVLVDERVEDHAHALTLRKRFTDGLKGMSKSVSILGSDASVVPGIVYVLTGKINGDTLAVMMDAAGAAVSSGSACDAGIRGTASAVGAVLGNGTNGIRFSFGRGTTEADIDAALEALDAALRRP